MIDYQKRYEDWQSNFQHDENGKVITHQTRSGKEEATLVKGARDPFDKGRPVGSVGSGKDIDHTVPAGEIIRDPAANAHCTKEEQIRFANSEANLNEMDAGQNRSKGDTSMTEWLDNPNKNGQKPNEIFDIDEEQDKKYREKDAEARSEYEKMKKEGEKRSIETGKQSQKEEAFRIGKEALRSIIMGLLATLLKTIIQKLIAWFQSGERKFKTFVDSVKQALKSFIFNIKEQIYNAGNTLSTTITTAIFGPVIGTIKKAWIFLKQGYKSIKEAIVFLKNPANKDKPVSIKLMKVGEIVIAGLSAVGAIALGEVIEKGLISIPCFGVTIPPFDISVANFLGTFLGALVSGLIGALALNLIDRAIAKKMKDLNLQQQIQKRNDIIQTQGELIEVTKNRVQQTKDNTVNHIKERHAEAAEEMKDDIQQILNNSAEIDTPLPEEVEVVEDVEPVSENNEDLDNLLKDIESI